MIRAALVDFDGTLTSPDVLAEIARLVGKKHESQKLDEDFHKGLFEGLDGIVSRVNLLKGLSLTSVKAILAEDPALMPGARELTEFLRARGIVTILASGNIVPVLEFYVSEIGLPADYIVASPVRIKDDVIEGIEASDYTSMDFKLAGVKKILSGLGIGRPEALAIGDSPADRSLFDFASYAIAINPKEGVGELADVIINDDLSRAIQIVEDLNH
ncbi:MAG TPA: HAD family phosphatase [Candidatus Saccharimonadia bacterium]|nr:HAD family phosphatase [Candidatus Saccharimonadia bacterium]